MAKGTGNLIGALRAQLAATRIPAAVKRESERRAEEIASDEATRIVDRASSAGRQARFAARSVNVSSERGDPVIEAGGAVPLRSGVQGSEVFFGSEFGGGSRPRTRQFPPYRADGHWFGPVLEDDEDRIFDEWGGALDAGAAVWKRGA